jgi:gliding motility-associated-like protein
MILSFWKHGSCAIFRGKYLACFVFLVLIYGTALSQDIPSGSWTTNPFSGRSFIINAGQFDQVSGALGKIRFGVRKDGIEIFFYDKGIRYSFRKISQAERGEREREDKVASLTMQTSEMEWVNANPSVGLTGEEPMEEYFTYSDLSDPTGRSSFKAQAFRKIKYSNLYPGIDVVYEFPSSGAGIKYTLYIHPGADASSVKMAYLNVSEIAKDLQGNCIIPTPFGPITDHAPVTSLKGGRKLTSSFRTQKNTITFDLGPHDPTVEVIIDPWLTVPNFPADNKVYDVDWDYQGNIYAYGGKFPYRLAKLNSSGTVLWTFSGTTMGDTTATDYGDFAIDRSSGEVFVCQGFSYFGVRILKVSTSGTQIALSPLNPDVGEFWRIAYNSCTKTGTTVCGCSNCPSGSTNKAKLAGFNNSLTTFTDVDILSACHGDSISWGDMAMLALDDSSVYAVSCDYSPTGGVNSLVRCLLPTFAPTTFCVPSQHRFVERTSIKFIEGVGVTNGFNGLAKGKSNLYSYDGSLINQWNPWNGAHVRSLTVSTDSFRCGGLVVDGCDHLFTGNVSSVKQYDTSLNLVNVFHTQDTVFDVAIALGNIIAGGVGFVANLGPTPTGCGCVNSCDAPTSCTANCETLESLIVPNVFSPNGDGKNDLFYPSANSVYTPEYANNLFASYSLSIYDRWGVKVFDSSSLLKAWDGKDLGGKQVTDGVYYWMLTWNAKCPDSRPTSLKGFVQVVR